MRNLFSAAIAATAAAAVLTLAPAANAQVVLGRYNASGFNTVSTTNTPLPASSVATGLTFSSLQRGAGVTQAANTTDAFNSTGFATGTPLSLANNDYIFFTITNNSTATQTVTLSSIDISHQRSAQGPLSVTLFSSITGFTNVAQGIQTFSPGTGTTATTVTLGGTTFTALANTSIEFRLYGFNAGNTGGTFRISGSNIAAGGAAGSAGNPQGIVVRGSVNAITSGTDAPEPGALVLALTAGVPAVGVIARRRKAAAKA